MRSQTEVDMGSVEISEQVEDVPDAVTELRATLEQRISQINGLEQTMHALESEVEKLRGHLKEQKSSYKNLEK